MKRLKKPTTAILMATLIFSNMQLCPIYGDTVENTSKQIVEKNIELKNIKIMILKKIIKIKIKKKVHI